MPNVPAIPAKAIIVEDSPIMLSMLNTILRSDGVDVIGQLSSGKKLLETIANLSPDIVCLDYNLPDINGIDLLKSISAEHPHVAVLMITGDNNPDLQNVAAEFGAAGFIHKPYSQDQVIKEFRQIIQTQRLLADVVKPYKTSNEDLDEIPVITTAIIVDDSRAIRVLLAAVLSKYGFKVIGEASNGLQAVELVSQLNPDLVCLDIVMPVMDGMEALKQIRKTNPETKVVMITSNSSRDFVMNALKEGAVGFIVKPFDVENVGEMIARVLLT
jgi:two-component system, response regulator PdtaR